MTVEKRFHAAQVAVTHTVKLQFMPMGTGPLDATLWDATLTTLQHFAQLQLLPHGAEFVQFDGTTGVSVVPVQGLHPQCT